MPELTDVLPVVLFLIALVIVYVAAVIDRLDAWQPWSRYFGNPAAAYHIVIITGVVWLVFAGVLQYAVWLRGA